MKQPFFFSDFEFVACLAQEGILENADVSKTEFDKSCKSAFEYGETLWR
jgi:hypothetical protein